MAARALLCRLRGGIPADKLKIDRSFIHEIETVPSAAAVVLAVISFARAQLPERFRQPAAMPWKDSPPG